MVYYTSRLRRCMVNLLYSVQRQWRVLVEDTIANISQYHIDDPDITYGIILLGSCLFAKFPISPLVGKCVTC